PRAAIFVHRWVSALTPAFFRTTPQTTPASHIPRRCSSAISGLVLKLISSGTLALRPRLRSSARFCGKYVLVLRKELANRSHNVPLLIACHPNKQRQRQPFIGPALRLHEIQSGGGKASKTRLTMQRHGVVQASLDAARL